MYHCIISRCEMISTHNTRTSRLRVLAGCGWVWRAGAARASSTSSTWRRGSSASGPRTWWWRGRAPGSWWTRRRSSICRWVLLILLLATCFYFTLLPGRHGGLPRRADKGGVQDHGQPPGGGRLQLRRQLQHQARVVAAADIYWFIVTLVRHIYLLLLVYWLWNY